MRDPDMFKYDVRVRDRMLRAGRITGDEVNQLLQGLPDLEASVEAVPLNQPALDAAASAAASTRQSVPPSASGDEVRHDAVDEGDGA